MIREAAVSLDAYDPDKILLTKPDLYRFCDLHVTEVNGVPITAGDKEKYSQTGATIILKGKRHARYWNMMHARVKDVHEVFPDNATPAASLPDDFFIHGTLGNPSPIGQDRPGVIVRRYDLSDERKRARLADHLNAVHSEFRDTDLNLDGCCVPELVFFALPWRFKDTCDFLSKVRQRLPQKPKPGEAGGCELGINLSGALADLKPSVIDRLIDTGISYVVFEQITKEYDDNALWTVTRNASRLLQRDVLPIFCTKITREIALCRQVCEATGAAMAI